MPNPTQATRHIAIDTPLGEDVLLLRSFSAHEEVSRLFEFDLELLSEDYEINFDDIIGQNVTISMELPGGGKRYWNGFINRFVQGVTTSVQFAQYRATMVPWLWFLTRTSDCRIFQEKTVPDIVKQIFNDLGFSDIEDRLSGGYKTWKYCVQYRETDFNFISRMMEQEGIYYYFLHEQDKCTIVLCDSLSKHDPYEGYEEIEYNPDVKSSALQEQISAWTIEMNVRTGKFAYNDYNFEKPKTSLMSVEQDVKEHANAGFEIYDYPGEYPEKNDGEKYAKVRMEELISAHEVCNGQSDSRGICTGYTFTMEKHSRSDQNRDYLILSSHYQAAAEDYETSRGQGEICNCSFTSIPSTVQFRPTRSTSKPMIRGTQTAVVTGPSGEEIYTDEHGRVKVQFHWDREGKYDENTSCWIRVSQVHAGKGFGGIDIPRIGEEVIVSFMEGDPNRPLITGRVYNAELMPPFGLPGEKVVSGMKSNSTIGGGGYNEFTMNDTKGKEKITVHGQYDMSTTVEHDDSQTVHNNRTVTVNGTLTETIKKATKITISEGPYEHKVAANTAKYTVKGAITETYQDTQSTTVTKDITIKSNTAKIDMNAATEIKLVTGASQLLMKKDGTIKLTGKNISIGGDTSIKIDAPQIDASGKKAIKVGVGNSVTKHDPQGVTTSGAKINSSAVGVHEIKGAVVKIN